MTLSNSNTVVVNQIIELEKQEEIERYWKRILEMLVKRNGFREQEAVMENLYTTSVRIGQSLAKNHTNKQFFIWAKTGLESVTHLLHTPHSPSTQDASLLQKAGKRVARVLRRSIEIFYDKPHSQPQEFDARGQLMQKLELLESELGVSADTTSSPSSLGESSSESEDDKEVMSKTEANHETNDCSESNQDSSNDAERVGIAQPKPILKSILKKSPQKCDSSSLINSDLGDRNGQMEKGANQILSSEQKIEGGELLEKDELSNQNEEQDSDIQEDNQSFTFVRVIRSPKNCDTQSNNSSDTKYTDLSSGKHTPKSLLKNSKRRYKTRFSLREDKRLYAPRIRIKEGENEVKEFHKRRNITTDFEFNPRFDTHKSRKRSKKSKQKIEEPFVLKSAPTILKPDPLKNQFW